MIQILSKIYVPILQEVSTAEAHTHTHTHTHAHCPWPLFNAVTHTHTHILTHWCVHKNTERRADKSSSPLTRRHTRNKHNKTRAA